MAHDSAPSRVRQWYAQFYLLPMCRLEESIEQQEQELKDDPLNFMARSFLGWSLTMVSRMADAQLELHKVLEFEQNYPWAWLYVSYAYALQEKWTEALYFAEKASSIISWANGIIAGVLKRTGEVTRAEELIRKIMQCKNFNDPLALTHFYLLCKDIDRATDWFEKAIEQRESHLSLPFFRSSSRWSSLAELMNLPEEAR
jgi:tetratricopeptide (TPR) repeat protein